LNNKTPRVNEVQTEESRYARLGDVVNIFYNSKISGTDRTLAQLLADRIVGEGGNVNYGMGVGIINVDKQVTEFFNVYLDNNWVLKTQYNGNELEWGHEVPKDITREISYVIALPIPYSYSEVIKLNLETW
jgi:hypothetical protein